MDNGKSQDRAQKQDSIAKKEGVYFDYPRQAWVLNGRYIKCGHPDEMNCTCYGKLHEGEEAIQ